MEKNFFRSDRKGREIELKTNEQTANLAQEAGPELMNASYNFLDSFLDSGKESFFTTFKETLPEGEKSLKEYIEKILAERKGQAIAIEFGGVGRNLFHDFSPDFFKKTFGITLADHEKLSKETGNHTVIESNIFSEKLDILLNKNLGGEKVDLIIERMLGGLEYTPIEPYMLGKILQNWYSRLREGGIMFIQTPIVFNKLVARWHILLKQEYGKVIEFQKNYGSNDAHPLYTSSFRLRKLEGAPEELPLIDPRIVFNTEKWQP